MNNKIINSFFLISTLSLACSFLVKDWQIASGWICAFGITLYYRFNNNLKKKLKKNDFFKNLPAGTKTPESLKSTKIDIYI